jgi:AraC family transcriptional regulator
VELEWIKALKESIDYMEKHLLSDCTMEKVADYVHISPFYFQKAFKMMTGYTIGEYIRNRRLYLAALDLIKTEEKVIELAYRYGYDTPESFTKAFSRFHGLSPMQMKKLPYKIKPFLPLKISISVKGGDQMEYSIESMEAFEVIGIGRRFSYEEAFDKIPSFWREWKNERDCTKETDLFGYCIGKYGISIDEGLNSSDFYYLIAGDYKGNLGQEGFNIVKIPALTWAKFRCIGPMPEALQALNTRIFNEWLPENVDYEIASGYNIEIYEEGDINNINYRSEIWIPVRKQTKKQDKSKTNQS